MAGTTESRTSRITWRSSGVKPHWPHISAQPIAPAEQYVPTTTVISGVERTRSGAGVGAGGPRVKVIPERAVTSAAAAMTSSVSDPAEGWTRTTKLDDGAHSVSR